MSVEILLKLLLVKKDKNRINIMIHKSGEKKGVMKRSEKEEKIESI